MVNHNLKIDQINCICLSISWDDIYNEIGVVIDFYKMEWWMMQINQLQVIAPNIRVIVSKEKKKKNRSPKPFSFILFY